MDRFDNLMEAVISLTRIRLAFKTIIVELNFLFLYSVNSE